MASLYGLTAEKGHNKMTFRQWINSYWIAGGTVLLFYALGAFITMTPTYSNEELAAYATARTVTIMVTQPVNTPKCLGSGVLVSKEGHVLTAAHLFRGEVEAVIVHDENGNESRAEVIFVDFKRDLAILKTSFVGRPYAPIAIPAGVKPGQEVLIAGSPLGLEFSVCHGIISATGRDLPNGYDLVQSDSMVNPGNSGGPAFNVHGEIVGICSFFEYHEIPVNQGLSFFVSSGEIRKFMTRFKGIMGRN